jgi:hypothetical protein
VRSLALAHATRKPRTISIQTAALLLAGCDYIAVIGALYGDPSVMKKLDSLIDADTLTVAPMEIEGRPFGLMLLADKGKQRRRIREALGESAFGPVEIRGRFCA